MGEEKKGFGKWLRKNIVIALICALILGLLIGLGIMYFANNGVAVHVKGKNITSADLYNKIKASYPMDALLEEVDEIILKNKYKLEEDELKEIQDEVDHYIKSAVNYGYTEEEFLSTSGFKSVEDFVDYMSLYYKRNIYFYEYLEKQLEKNAVQEYYDANAFGKVNTKHILVRTGTEEATDEQALDLAKKIIERLNNGEDFDALASEYTEKYPNYIITEDLGEMGAFSHLEASYIEAMKALNKGEYTKEPIQTSYGYHVIYCVDRTQKSDKISRSDRMEIIEKLAEDIVSENPNIYYEAITKMREDAGLKFYDKVLKQKYDEFLSENENAKG